MATLEELTTPLTKDEVEAAIYAAIEARGVATTSWRSGSIARTIIAGASIVLSAFSTLQSRIAASGFLEKSEGDWLTIVAEFVYGVERNEGTFASGNVVFNNAGGGVFSPGVGDIIVSNSATGKTYRNTAAFTLSAFETGKSVPFQAIESGADSTSPAGFIDALETTLLGVSITNPLALVGNDPESDPELRARCLAKTGTLSPNGPSDAYRFVAFDAKKGDGTPVGITRLTATPDGSGNVGVYVANATGPVSGSIGDTDTDLGAVDAAIQSQVVPLAVTANVESAVANVIAVTYEVWARGSIGTSDSELANEISTALASFMSEQPIGGSRKVAGSGFVFAESIESVIAETVGSRFLIDMNMTAPASDTSISGNEAPVLGSVSATINMVYL